MKIATSNPSGILGYLASNADRDNLEFSFLSNEILKLDGDLRGLQIVCQRGRLWITQIGDEEDYTLQIGGGFVVTRSGLVLIQSLGEGQVQLISPSRLWITSCRNKAGSNPLIRSRISKRPQLQCILRCMFVMSD